MIAVYGRDVAPKHARPRETGQRMKALLGFFGRGGMTLSRLNGDLCRRYADHRGSDAAARRELEDLRAAINHFHAEGHVRELVRVVLPPRRPARERWLRRDEAAQLLRLVWRQREDQGAVDMGRYPWRHIARFILIGLYTGRRAGAIVQAALQPTEGRGWIDTARGVFFPAPGLTPSKKRQPPIPLPRRLVAHIRRWKKRGARYAVEWNGQPVSSIDKAFRNAAREAGLDDVTPHTLRHTAATWMMQRGADPWAASGYLGMSLETLLRTYGHHHPDHLRGAWSVFDRPGGEAKPPAVKGRHRVRHRIPGTKAHKGRRKRRKAVVNQ